MITINKATNSKYNNENVNVRETILRRICERGSTTFIHFILRVKEIKMLDFFVNPASKEKIPKISRRPILSEI